MSSGVESNQPTAHELLADRAMQGLSHSEAAELARLLAMREGAEADSDAMELAAAALDLAMDPGPYEPMPTALRARIEQDAHRAQRAAEQTSPIAGRIGPRPSGISGAWLAAAACLLLAVAAWWPRTAPAPASSEQRLASLVSSASDVTRIDWKAAGELAEANITGQVVWSSEKQEGYMVFAGLPANDPTREQYQLWIFDPSQSDKTPIDGGVFDAVRTADGRVIVPIDPKLAPTAPTLFAITIEKPGGVVVSDRSRLVLLAAKS